jgi:hypothetical protein
MRIRFKSTVWLLASIRFAAYLNEREGFGGCLTGGGAA